MLLGQHGNAPVTRRSGPCRPRLSTHRGLMHRVACSPPLRPLQQDAPRNRGADSEPSTSGQDQQEPRGPRWLSWLPAFLRRDNGEGVRVTLEQLTAVVRAIGVGVILLGLMSCVRLAFAVQARNAPKQVLYSDFVSLIDTHRVRSARLEAGSSRLFFDVRSPEEAAVAAKAQAAAASGKRQKAAPAPAPAAAAAGEASTSGAAAADQKASHKRRFYVKIAEKNDPFLVSRLLATNVEFGVVKQTFAQSLANIMLSVLALWIPLMPLLFIMRGALGARSGMGRKKKKAVTTPVVTFADVAGCDSAKQELVEVVACLRNADQYSRVRARMPSGVLLSGPPGTGKTLLAKAVAGEAGVPFISCSASEFVEMFVGRGAARVREVFAEARKAAPCVVFIDELDALGGRRGVSLNDERDQTLNQLLTELDGFEGRPGVMLLAATNRVDTLDSALTRPGRISRKIVVPLPNEEGRRAIMGVHLRDVPMASGLEREDAAARIAAITPGFSGAELANVVNEASLLAARSGHEQVTLLELAEGVRRTRFGVNGGAEGAAGPGGALRRGLGALLYQMAGEDDRRMKAAAL